ncbi:uncharacterized protein EV420DRAFT_1645851 [Desarmillaria tabescens]|uniref:DUF7770 domain-containing protein n=1 Tax=Armillaria tabescens TaxID=1929756 RepID=A0AA39MZV6_ARMTA|nr:uncharacterized protein EV420DRAFT_1645851 [Desarmillaria tabescens]KAK0452209.1 hypothetical protein EV420DRAFT_1645851 [Desarmillaria tabescens]
MSSYHPDFGRIETKLQEDRYQEPVTRIKIVSKNCLTPDVPPTVISHFYLSLLSPSSPMYDQRVQLDLQKYRQDGVLVSYIACQGRDGTPSGMALFPRASVPMCGEDVTLGDILRSLAAAGLDTGELNANGAGCRRWIYQCLHHLAEKGIIESSWRQVADQYVADVRENPLSNVVDEDVD